MGSTELAANLFRATQTDEKLRRDQLVGKKEAGDVHFQVGQKVRQTIRGRFLRQIIWISENRKHLRNSTD